MKDDPVKRLIIDALAAISLLLCVGIILLWPRTFWRSDNFRFALGGSTFVIDSANSTVALGVLVGYTYPPPYDNWRVRPRRGEFPWRTLGFGWDAEEYFVHYSTYTLCIPYWFLLLIAAFVPSCWLYGRRQRNRTRAGFPVT